MKRTLITAIAVAALASPTLAADLPVRGPVMKAPPPVAAVYNWTGFYSATVVGGGWEEIDGTYVNFAGGNHNTSQSRGWWGSAYGAQYQWNNIVLGVEGAYSTPFNSDFGTSLSPSADCLGGAAGVADRTCESRIRNYWTVGGKLGVAWNNWLFYGTGGYANGRVQTATFVTSAPATLTSFTSERHTGWYAGVGLDVFITKIWWSDLILGVEYQHVAFDTRLHADLLPGATGINNRDVDASLDVVRAKITFKFTPGGVVQARY
jgi:outer membrane immunogenic protein